MPDSGKIIIRFLTKGVASPWKPGYAIKCPLFLKGEREPHCAMSFAVSHSSAAATLFFPVSAMLI